MPYLDHFERICDEALESARRPMMNVLRGVPEIAKIFEAQHVAEAPPRLVGHACQQVPSAYSGQFTKRGQGIADVLKYFQNEDQVEGLGREGHRVNICSTKHWRGETGFREARAFNIEVHSDDLWEIQALDNFSLSAARVKNGVNSYFSDHVGQGVEETPIRELGQSAFARIFLLSWGAIDR